MVVFFCFEFRLSIGLRIFQLVDTFNLNNLDCVSLLSQTAMPFAVVGSNQIIEVKGRKVRGRMYPWGVVEVENPEHCDFIKLRTMLM